MTDPTPTDTFSPAERSVLRGTWFNMVHRCTRSTSPDYGRYGARGITVCDRWLNSFDDFAKDMGPRPTPQHSLDRIDNDKGYYPKNCRWADRATQALNRASNVNITHGGETLTAIEWARRYNIVPTTFYSRLNDGWQPPRLFQRPRPYASRKGVAA